MPGHSMYDNSYTKPMNEKIRLFNNLTLRAEIILRDNQGKRTEEEAKCYAEASKVCAEIMNANLSNRATYEKWRRLQKDCEDKVREIVDILAPQPPQPPQPETVMPEDPMDTRSIYPPEFGTARRPQTPRVPQPPQPQGQARPSGQPVKGETASGFQTRNASKDIPAETIEKWHVKEKPKLGLDDLVGLEEQKKVLREAVSNLGWDLTEDVLGISPTQNFFFYGPPGSGKTSLINAFAHDMMERGFKFLHLEGGDIHQPLVGLAEQTVQAAFQEAIDNAPCMIFIDEVENVCPNRSGPNVQGHESRLTIAFLEARSAMLNSGKRVVFLGATNFPDKVDVAMRDAAYMIRTPLPSEQAREDYFKKTLAMLPLEPGLEYEYMVDRTDNYSYRDLVRLTGGIKKKAAEEAKERYSVVGEDGQIDQTQSDKNASDALKSGEILLSKEWFDQVQESTPPTGKAKIREELLAFEREVENG